MLIKDWMETGAATVDADASMQDAKTLMKVQRLRMLPVLKSGKLVGVVTDGDLKKASPSDATSLDVHEITYLQSKIKVSDVMTKEPITVSPNHTVEQVAMLFIEKEISGAPVLDEDGSLAGTITQNDIFRVLVSLTGSWHRGIQFGFLLDDRPGSIKEVADIIREFGGRIISILGSLEGAPWKSRYVYIRIRPIDKNLVRPLMDELQKVATITYVLDQRDGGEISCKDDPPAIQVI